MYLKQQKEKEKEKKKRKRKKRERKEKEKEKRKKEKIPPKLTYANQTKPNQTKPKLVFVTQTIMEIRWFNQKYIRVKKIKKNKFHTIWSSNTLIIDVDWIVALIGCSEKEDWGTVIDTSWSSILSFKKSRMLINPGLKFQQQQQTKNK